MLNHTVPAAADACRIAAIMKIIGDEIERLIAIADALDGDADFEPDLAGGPNQGAPCDAEGDDSDLELSGDENEPSLGSLCGTAAFHLGTVTNWTSQTDWAGGALDDAEGPGNGDDEDGHDQEASNLAGSETDNEGDLAETGIGDEEGLEEQCGRFDRSGDEHEVGHRPWSYEAEQAKRRLLSQVDREARVLAARLTGSPPAPIRDLHVVGPDGHVYALQRVEDRLVIL